MKDPTTIEIQKAVQARGGSYKKLPSYMNGNDVYQVNGMLMSLAQMIEAYKRGDLL
jgi:hypothetical protein